MERTIVMAARVFAPAGAAMLAAAVLVFAGSDLSDHPMLRGIATEWDVLVDVALAAAFALAIHAMFRLWRWEQGRALACPSCGGLLGWEHDGRHGPYRKCFGCSKNIGRINYAR